MNPKYFTIWKLLLIGGMLLVSACTASAETTEAPSSLFELEDCQLTSLGNSLQLDAKCGQLAVYEDRQAKSGRRIELNIAVIPAVSRNPAPDPIFFIPGGPGEAATESFLVLYSAFADLNQKRDIILVDQRGTGGSNPLQCSPQTDPESNQDPANDDDYLNSIKDCVSALDANLKLYTTAIAMDDLDEVRQVLGYEKINIYGASYGTRAALSYLRQYPDRVRTLILDGIVPAGWALGPSVATDAQRALDIIFSRCAADPICQAAFPDLSMEFAALLDELEQDPATISMIDPTNGEEIEHTLTKEEFANTIHFMSYQPETTALLPQLIHTAYKTHDYSRIAAQALSSQQLVGESISNGMRFSVICAEDVPIYKQPSSQDGYMGSFVSESFAEICTIWPRGEIPTDFTEPVHSDVPVLLISGEADPVTPPVNGDFTAQTLSNSLHLIVPGMGHVNIYRSCMPKIFTQFVEIADSKTLDTSCIQQTQPMPFFINFNGPVP